MDLIQMKKMVKDKAKNRDKLLGQKEMLTESLKKLGFKSISEAKKAKTKLHRELTKMEAHYEKGKDTFVDKYEHLLQP